MMELRLDLEFSLTTNKDPGYNGKSGDNIFRTLLGIDWNNPQSILEALGEPVPRSLSLAEILQEAKPRVNKIFESYDKLRKIMERHEATIQKRWTKKTRQQRLQILLKAWPGMPTSSRPDFEAFLKETPEQRKKGTKYRDCFMWPYINQEDLSQTRLLPILLNARGRHAPATFAATDNSAMHLGKVTNAITPISAHKQTMILNGATSVNEYGKLIAWESHPYAFAWLITRWQFSPGEGLLVLEAQERLLCFLVECCQELLHDIPANSLTSDAFLVEPEPPLRTDTNASGFASLASVAAEAPYRVPAQLDLGWLESLLEAKTSAAEDHMWILREDPSYFAHQLLTAKDHRPEMLEDTAGHLHPITNKVWENLLWIRIISNFLVETHSIIEFFSELHRQARELRIFQQRYKEVISPLRNLPEDYFLALLKFRHCLKQLVKELLNQLKMSVASSPPMRKFYVREPSTDLDPATIVIKPRLGVKLTKVEKYLIWLLTTLWDDGFSLFLARLPSVVDELERLSQAEPEVDTLISTYVMKIIGDLSIMSQCLKQLDLYQPWADTFETTCLDWAGVIKKDYAERSKSWDQIFDAFVESDLTKVTKIGQPSPGKFSYPINKRRTRETVDALRLAESNLDKFWAKVDEVMHAKASKFHGSAVHRLLSQPRMLRRTAEWVEPTPNAKAKLVSDLDLGALSRPLSDLYFGLPGAMLQEPTGSSTLATPFKVKTKTKGVPSPSQIDIISSPQSMESTPKDSQPTFSIDARALKVFRTLFFNPDVTSTPGEIPWNDFLHAMTSTGFKIEKLYGSVWQFSPSNLDVKRSIHFHEPHPKGKIPFEVARRHGRRLNRAYGWFGGMFFLREK